MRLSLAHVPLLLLAACQGATSGSDSGSTSLRTPPDLPPGYRASAARQLAAEYLADAVGPAEIQPKPATYEAFLGSSTLVGVRYPVRKTRLFRQHTIAMRCMSIRAFRSVSTLGDTKFTIARAKIDPDECLPTETFEPYVELNQIAATIGACKARGEMPCLISTNMPEGDARGLMRAADTLQRQPR